MPFEFRLPDLGEGIQEAELLTWNVSPGQSVAAFQPLCQVESAKAAVELTSPVAGTVLEVCVAEGAVAQRGDLLVVLDTSESGALPHPPAPSPAGRGGENPSENSSEKAATNSSEHAAANSSQHVTESSAQDAAADEPYFGIVGAPPRGREPTPAVEGRRVRAAPFVRKLARDLGVPIENVAATGPHGRVRASDVEALARQPAHTNAAHSSQALERIPLRGLRREIAEHMVTAMRNAPQVTSMDLLDATNLVAAREALMPSAEQEGVKLTYVPFFVKACVEALKAVPEANASVEDDAIVLKREYHIGIATAVPGGLVVPVVRHADKLTLLEIANEAQRLVEQARQRKSAATDLQGGTFTITSFGGLSGSPMFATPILNYPEVAILGIGRIDQQPRVVDGQVVPRMCVGVSFTFDHRVLDGDGAGRFMATLKRYLEQPLQLLLRLR